VEKCACDNDGAVRDAARRSDAAFNTRVDRIAERNILFRRN
jgi:hypothetical protein